RPQHPRPAPGAPRRTRRQRAVPHPPRHRAAPRRDRRAAAYAGGPHLRPRRHRARPLVRRPALRAEAGPAPRGRGRGEAGLPHARPRARRRARPRRPAAHRRRQRSRSLRRRGAAHPRPGRLRTLRAPSRGRPRDTRLPAGLLSGGLDPMSSGSRRSVFLVLLVSLAPASVRAAGFALFEHGGKGMGFAGAFTAQASDPSAIFHNPAGIAFLRRKQVYLGGTAVMPTWRFEGASPFPGAGVSEHDSVSVLLPPAAYYTQAFSPRVA